MGLFTITFKESLCILEEDKKKWECCLNGIKTILSPAVYKEWIEPVKIVDVKDSLWTLGIPETFSQEQFSMAYLGLIKNYFIQINKELVEFKIKVISKVRKKNSATSDLSFISETFFNPQYTFEDFVVGKGSQFAYSAAQSMANDPNGVNFNPMLIYSNSGLGKTHLLHSIGNQIQTNFPKKRVRYVPFDIFYNDFISALQENQGRNFSKYYHEKVDVLLIDDIQFFSNKNSTQDEFFHIFNALHQLNKKIVMTSDQPPHKLDGLEERLISRFQWGLIVDIKEPDLETREAILKKKAQTHNFPISDEIISYLAESIETNVRLLEGAIRQILIRGSINKNLTIEIAKEVIQHIGMDQKKNVTNTNQIIEVVADYFQVEVANIISKKRGPKEVAQARQVAIVFNEGISKNFIKINWTKIW